MMMPYVEFKALAGYDLVGVASPSAFAGLSPGESPLSLFPDAQSVVVLGRRIRRGVFRSMEEGSLWSVAGRWLTGMDGVVRAIERLGYECVPFTPADAPRMPREPVRPGQCRPNGFRISVEYAAVAAGLGEIGYHGMFMTEQFGIRQSLGLLVTDLPIEPGAGRPAGQRRFATSARSVCVPARCRPSAPSCQGSGSARPAIPVGGVNALACQACPNGVAGDAKYFAGAEELHFEIENNQVKGKRPAVLLAAAFRTG